MSSRSVTWIIGFGGVILFAGVITLLALFGQAAAPDQLVVGSSLFSIGIMFIAAGVYLKARLLAAAPPSGARDKQLGHSKSPRRGHCQLCAQEEPVVQCQTHAWQLCAACLASHYDSRSCQYVPLGRTAKGGSRGPLNPRWA